MIKNDEELIVLATTLAMQLAKGLTGEELDSLRMFLNQMCCSISSLINEKHKRKK